jgi:hypothetical protein
MRISNEKNEGQHVKAVTFKLDGAKCGELCTQPEQLLRSFSDRIYRMSRMWQTGNGTELLMGRLSVSTTLMDLPVTPSTGIS